MNSLYRDLRYGIRSFLRKPIFTATAVITLALGVGVNTAVFSILDTVALRPLPFHDPHELMVLQGTSHNSVVNSGMISYADLEDFRAESRSFQKLAALHAVALTLTGLDVPERIIGGYVSADFFPLLGVEAAHGRLFRAEEDRPGAEEVAVISHGFWQQRFDGDPGLVGRTLALDGVPFTVVGILPADFSFPVDLRAADVWTTTARDASTFPGRGSVRVKVVGRLKPGVTPVEAQTEMDTITRRLALEFPALNTGRGVRLVSLHEQVVGDVRPVLIVLLGAVGLVLLAACANVASMLLARSAERRKEFAIRAALGAGASHLFRQLLSENILLGFVGSTIGVLVAAWALDALVAAVPSHVPRVDSAAIDARVLGFTLLTTVFTVLVFGLMPALSVSRLDLQSVLKEGGHTTAPTSRHRLRQILVVSQVTVALVLLVGASLLIRSFQRLVAVDPGFQPENVLAFQLSVARSEFGDPADRAALYDRVLERLENLPGVQSVGAITNLPLHPAYASDSFLIQGRPTPAPGQTPVARYDSVSAGYFQTMNVPLLRGRIFTEQDTVGHPSVMIINETMARRFWPEENPLGQHVITGGRLNDGSPAVFEIVGVIGDVRDTRLDAELEPCMYVPYRQQALRYMCFALRADVDPLSLVSAVRKEVAAVTRDDAPFEFASITQLLQRSVAERRVIMLVLSVFAVAALGLAVVGLYGVLSCLSIQRTHEIGVRMALGAQRSDVLRLMLIPGLRLVATGLGVGLTLSLAGTRVLSSQLFEVGPTDPLTFVGVSLLLAAVALLACYFPARRATKVDPMVALRCE